MHKDLSWACLPLRREVAGFGDRVTGSRGGYREAGGAASCGQDEGRSLAP